MYEDIIAGIKIYVDDPLPNDPNKLSELRTIFEKLEIAFLIIKLNLNMAMYDEQILYQL